MHRLTAPAGHLLVAALATFPLVLSPLSRLIGHEDVDVWNHAWGPWWYWLSLGRGHLPWETTLLGAPDGGVLWYIDPWGALAGAPLVGILGVVGAYNAVLFVWLALTSLAAHRLARSLGATGLTPWIASVATACSPYVLSEVHNGVSEAVGVQWAIFALAAARGAIDAPSWRRWAATGLWLGVTAAGTWYYALGAAVTIATWTALRFDRRAAAGLALAGVLSAALAAPVYAVVSASVHSPRSLVQRGELGAADREMLLSHNAVDPRAWVAPGGFQSVDLASSGEAFRHSSYLGLVALALAFASRRPAVLAGAIPCALLGLGPYLWWSGAWVELAPGTRIGLPFQWLLSVLPDAAATHAQRVSLPVIAVVAALAAVGAGRVPRPWLLLPIVAMDALLSAPWPLARAPALDTTAHAALREGAVLDLPAEVGATMATSRYLVYQTASGRPIPYRPDARAGTSTLLGIPSFWVLAIPSIARPEHRAPLERMAADIKDVSLYDLVGKGIRWVVVHRELDRAAQGIAGTERQLEAWFGAPEIVGTHVVFDTRRATSSRGRILPRE